MTFYLVKVAIFLIFKGLSNIKVCSERSNKITNYLSKGLFYAELIAIIIDGYFEFGISLYLQVQFDYDKLFDYSVERDSRLLEEDQEDGISWLKPIVTDMYLGDILSRVYALILFISMFVFMPYAFGNILLRKFDVVKSEALMNKFEPLYEDLSLHSQKSLQFFLMYCMRRLWFILIVYVLVENLPGLQLLFVLYSNLVMLVHTGLIEPFDNRLQNKVILMNEFGIGIISYHLFFFTDWVQDQAVQSNYGWSMVSLISLFTAFNISLVIYFGGRGIWLLLLKFYLRLKHKLNPGLNYLESRLESY